jgi:hypothetical protein
VRLQPQSARPQDAPPGGRAVNTLWTQKIRNPKHEIRHEVKLCAKQYSMTKTKNPQKQNGTFCKVPAHLVRSLEIPYLCWLEVDSKFFLWRNSSTRSAGRPNSIVLGRLPLNRRFGACSISNPHHKRPDRNVFIEIIPMNARPPATNNEISSLGIRGMKQSRKIGQRNTHLATVSEFHPHRIRLEPDFLSQRLRYQSVHARTSQ